VDHGAASVMEAAMVMQTASLYLAMLARLRIQRDDCHHR
jgi:hypothetical protein